MAGTRGLLQSPVGLKQLGLGLRQTPLPQERQPQFATRVRRVPAALRSLRTRVDDFTRDRFRFARTFECNQEMREVSLRRDRIRTVGPVPPTGSNR